MTRSFNKSALASELIPQKQECNFNPGPSPRQLFLPAMLNDNSCQKKKKIKNKWLVNGEKSSSDAVLSLRCLAAGCVRLFLFKPF